MATTEEDERALVVWGEQMRDVILGPRPQEKIRIVEIQYKNGWRAWKMPNGTVWLHPRAAEIAFMEHDGQH